MSSLKRASIRPDWEQYEEGSRRRRHFEHIVNMESDEFGELAPTPCVMCQQNSIQCRRYKAGICDSVTACSFCKQRSVSCSHSQVKSPDMQKSQRRTSVSLQNPPETPESIHIQQFRNMPSPRGTPTAGPSSSSSSLFAPVVPQMVSSTPQASPQLLDTCVNRMLELQKRMLQFGNDLRSPTPDMDSLQKEQRAQSAEVAALMALLLAERAR